VSKFFPGPRWYCQPPEGWGDLPVASRDVVGHRVAEDVLECALGRNVAAGLADHDGELHLVVELLRHGRIETIASPGPITASGALRKNSESFGSTVGFSSRWSQ
jgi:hypothetical protein